MLIWRLSVAPDEASCHHRLCGHRPRIMRTLLNAGLGSLLVLFVACYSPPYGFYDDSSGKVIGMDGHGNYTIEDLNRDLRQNRVVVETGTYEDGGGEEITLTTSDGRTYKIRVWEREEKRAQYRVLGQ